MTPDEAAQAAAKTARTCAGLCVLSLMVVVLVLIIDNQIKRSLMGAVAEAQKALRAAGVVADTFTVNAREYVNGAEAAEHGGNADIAGGNVPDSVGDTPADGPADDQGEVHAPFPPRAGGTGGARGTSRARAGSKGRQPPPSTAQV